MDDYKDYLFEMSKVEYQSPYLMVIWDYPPPLFKRYVQMLLDIPFEESNHNAYYGEIKKTCSGFLSCYSSCINGAIVRCDRYSQVINYSEMMDLFNKTVQIHDKNFQMVLNEFEPVQSDREQKQRDEIKNMQNKYRAELIRFGDRIKMFDKHNNEVLEFAKNHFEISVQRTSQLGEFTRRFLAKLIAGRLHRIRISLEDILYRIKKNSTDFYKNYEDKLDVLFDELYDLNKESRYKSQWIDSCSTENVEIQKKIDTITHKIENFGNLETFDRLASEIGYWSKTLHDFEEIASNITKAKKALDQAKEQKKIHEENKHMNLPQSQCSYWDNMGANFKQYIEDLEKKYVQAYVPIYTFFVCKGINHIQYEDAIGPYIIDEFGHQNYISQFATKTYHVNCDGQFIENRDDDKYYFDECGRYIIENGEKIYQLAPCTDKFKINDQGLFEKIQTCTCTRKCGHATETCDDIHDLTVMEILPKTEPVNVEQTLDAESVKYLWDTFGYLLPELLCEVAEEKPKNPIHEVAHLLVNKKYSMSAKSMQEKKKEANEYRAKFRKQRS